MTMYEMHHHIILLDLSHHRASMVRPKQTSACISEIKQCAVMSGSFNKWQIGMLTPAMLRQRKMFQLLIL